MTIVVAVSTPDGLVFASDSATTQTLRFANSASMTSHVWNSANKIFNLRKCWPIGAMTFGCASFNGRPIASHMKDLRLALSDPDSGDALDATSFTVEQVAQRIAKHFEALRAADPGGGTLGFIVGGTGAAEQVPEAWQVLLDDDVSTVIEQLLAPGQEGVLHQGVTEPIARLVDGVGYDLAGALERLKVPQPDAEQYAELIRSEMHRSQPPLAWQGMPLGESIDLARFLVETTVSFVRFTPGANVVGGPVELATLTKHEGFKWIARKHYYPQDLNREG